MKHLTWIAGLMWLAAAASPGQTLQLKQAALTPSDEVLVNPNMGLYDAGTLNEADLPAGSWFDKAISIGYFRDDWRVIQPDGPGPSHFDTYFKPIFDLWVNKLHKRVAFRFMSQNMHSQSANATPQWVFDQGVPSQTFKGIYVKKQTDPVFWDDKYLRIQEQTIADLGHYLDGKPGLEFIDIGSIGEWGEMHLMRWTPEQLSATGYTPEKYVAAYRRIIDAFARAFPHTHVFLNVGDWATINDYAAIHGVNFRQDGLTPSGPSANVGKRFYAEYARRGILCNYELFSGYDEMKQKGWGIAATFNKGLEDPISYFHMNLFGFHEMLTATPEVRTAVLDAARRVGYRFAPTEVKFTPTVSVSPGRNGRIMVRSTWTNSGVAPCTSSYALRWTIESTNGKSIAEKISFPDIPTTKWYTGVPIGLSDFVSIPADTQPGSYALKGEMFEPESPGTHIQLALANLDSSTRYTVASVQIVKGTGKQSEAYHDSFKAGTVGWTSPPGVVLTTAAATIAGANEPAVALVMSGQPQMDSWNYGSQSASTPILPASKYKLTCRMKISRITAGAPAPYVKLGINDSTGKWITNVSSNPYDLDRMGTWQSLEATVETGADAGTGTIAVEKGNLEAKPTVEIQLADVHLDLLESPFLTK